jgi:hypothetical protein
MLLLAVETYVNRSVNGILIMDRYLTKVTITKRPRLPSDSDDDYDGRSQIEGWATGAAVQGTKAGGTKMMEKRMPGRHKTTVLPRAMESIDPALMTGLVMVSIRKLICLSVYDIDLLS